MTKKKTKVTTVSGQYGFYSKKIINKLKLLEINAGDEIQIIQGEKEIKGNLLAQNDLGDPDSILIKLENGYNIGIKFTVDTEIVKLEGIVSLEDFNVFIPKQKPKLPSISLIATGGTIASRIDYQTGGVVMAMKPEEIFASLPELFDEISFKEVKSLFSMGSEDMFSTQWKEMAKISAKQLDSGSKGVVITHGTDTMSYSSAALSFMVQNLSGPIIFTGAQKSSDRGSYDGAVNLIAASRFAAKTEYACVGICMHQSTNDDLCQLTRGTKVRKLHTSRRDAFQAVNDSPIATIDLEGNILMNRNDIPLRSDGPVELNTNYEDNIALIKLHPGITPELLDWYVDREVKGVILEGTGLGHFPTFPPKEEGHRSWISAIERAIQEDIFVGMSSQCINGRVHPFVYRALRTGYKLGISYLEDMLSETAF
ncbi:MAG: Glu-tRNA(Gln) amidotransferase subunit GatD, partial [Candidatus Heimdallarchaeota archaeon]|nr:Glu-tRNA(Gln) amidotransferase subunit GatD [Candidatus Heimdallarchaeota archaeon]